MFRVIQGNRIDILADALAGLIQAERHGAFARPAVIVPSTAMQRWLVLGLADRLGFTAGVRFALPAAFAWSLIAEFVPGVPAESPFDAGVLQWRLTELLRQPAFAAAPALSGYLEGGSVEARFALARELATCLESYAVYRPDWLEAWSAGGTGGLDGDARWQAELWRAVGRSMPDIPARHPAGRLWERLESDAAAAARLPPSISLFAPDALPPPYLDFFRRLGEFTPTVLYLFNPCRQYWGALQRFGEARPSVVEGGPATAALLGALGQHGRSLVDMLIEADPPTADLWETPPEAQLLGALQADLLDLPEPDSVAPAHRAAIDGSIALHACHGPLREVEVLHDLLLRAFDADRTLRPEDVSIHLVEPARYAPLLEAVFDGQPDGRRIPVSGAGTEPLADLPLIRSILRLLEVARGRAALPDVIGLLAEPAMAHRFGLDRTDHDGLRDLLVRSGARWGWDDRQWHDTGFEGSSPHTWSAALDRILLGAVCATDSLDPIAGVAPVTGIGFDEAAGLQRFIATLAGRAQDLRSPRPLSGWISWFAALVEAFFDPRTVVEDEVQAFRSVLAELERGAARARFREPLPFPVALAALRAALERPARGAGRIGGAVRVLPLVPGQIVPARIVCLVGANDGALPAHPRSVSFDLLRSHPRRGDRQPRDADRFGFLAAVCAAGEQFVITWTGHDPRDDSPMPPAGPVIGLIESVARLVGAPFEEVRGALTADHPLQPFSDQSFAAASGGSYAAQWHPAGGGGGPARFIVSRLPKSDRPPGELTLADLRFLFQNPARFFVVKRLGFRLPEAEEALPASEPFVLDDLERYRLRDDLVRALLDRLPVDAVEARHFAAGRLPGGAAGRRAFRAEVRAAQIFAGRVAAARIGPDRSHRIDLQIGPVRIVDELDWPADGPLVVWRPGGCRAIDLVDAWIRHLLRSVTGGPAQSSLFLHRERKESVGEKRFAPVLREDASRELAVLAGLYAEALDRPLELFPETSLAWVKAVRESEGRAAPEAAALPEPDWTRSGRDGRSEGDDPYVRLVLRGGNAPFGAEFRRLATAVFRPLCAALEGASAGVAGGGGDGQ